MALFETLALRNYHKLHKGETFQAKAGTQSVEFKVVDFITDSVDSEDTFCLVDDNTDFFCDEALKVCTPNLFLLAL